MTRLVRAIRILFIFISLNVIATMIARSVRAAVALGLLA